MKVEDFRRPPGYTETSVKKNPAKNARKFQQEFCKFPVPVLHALIEKRGNWTVLAIVTVLLETWYIDPIHHNPVTLTSTALSRFGVSRQQKWRALKILESTPYFRIEQQPGKNPIVRLEWLPKVKPFGSVRGRCSLGEQVVLAQRAGGAH
jgi:hypothetical protein